MTGNLPQDGLKPINRQIRAEIRGIEEGSDTIRLTVLLDLLYAAEQCLRLSPPQEPSDHTSSWLEFRSHLKQLAAILPAVQTRLLVNRSRLERIRSHLDCALAWANSNKKSL